MEQKLIDILRAMGVTEEIRAITAFRSEEDDAPYKVWRIDLDSRSLVLKKTTVEEKNVYETFFPGGGGAVPGIYGFLERERELYLLMEYVPGDTMSRCDRHRLTRTLDALMDLQRRFWGETTHEGVGYDFAASYPNRRKRLPFLADLQMAYEAYLAEFARVPRTLCNDDLLPFNVIVGQQRAVIVDWEFGGILPYPCALARLLAFGEEEEGALFFMTAADKAFALDYYYENLVADKGIFRAEFDRTMQLFFFKEYSEWVYCAASSGDFSGAYYEKYNAIARKIAMDMGLLPRVVRCVWEHNGKDTLLHAVDYPGAYTRGPSLPIAMQKMGTEIERYLRWADLSVPETVTVEIVQDAACALAVCDADSDVLFEMEQASLTAEEYARLKALVLKSAADFQTLYDSVPEKDASVAAERRTFYGQVPRSAREMYIHTKNVNAYYFGEIGVSADNEGDIYTCRLRGLEALEGMPDFLHNRVLVGSWGESWNLRKMMRRFLWHDRIHAKAMYRMARKLWGADAIENPFFF